MPGIVGFTRGCSASDVTDTRSITKMQDMLTYADFYRKDKIFIDQYICGASADINVNTQPPQPVAVGPYYLWFDGEIYNQEELAPDATSVHQCIATLFQKEKKALALINGIFSCVIYDRTTRHIHCITDRYGLRGLYWTIKGEQFLWSSEVKSFLGSSDFIATIDPEAVHSFFEYGHFTGNTTWFKNVSLMPPASILTWSIDTQQHDLETYWSFDEIVRLPSSTDEEEIVEELGRRFIAATTLQSKRSQRLGVMLSGGLDSRALFAAIPSQHEPIQTFTFGQKNCLDIRISQKVAQLRPSQHHVIDVNRENWLKPRYEGVWWTDGHFNLIHMHGIHIAAVMRKYVDHHLNGFLGDAVLGGGYLDYAIYEDEIQAILNRGRRFINVGTDLVQVFTESRYTFFENNLLEFTLSIPVSLRKNSYIYKRMLLNFFPTYFKHIPWQRSEKPIRSDKSRLLVMREQILHFLRRVLRKLNRLGIPIPVTQRNYTNYDHWMRQEPDQFMQVLFNKNVIYPDYVSPDIVKELWEMHMAGVNLAEKIGLYATFEIWLQQVYRESLRPQLITDLLVSRT